MDSQERWGPFLMTMLSERELHRSRASELQLSQISSPRRKEAKLETPTITKKTENKQSSYVTLQGCNKVPHTGFRVPPRGKRSSFWCLFCNLGVVLLALFVLPREYDGRINIPAAHCNLRAPRRRTGSVMLPCAPFKAHSECALFTPQPS